MFSLSSLFRPAIAAAALLVATSLPAAAQPQPGQKFGDWTVGCDPAEGGQVCYIAQSLQNEANESVLVGIARPPQADPQFLVRVPLGVILTEGLGVRIDEQEPIRLPFMQCMPNGCQIVVPIEAETVDRLKAGNTLHISFVLPGTDRIVAPFSLKGFTAGFDALQ